MADMTIYDYDTALSIDGATHWLLIQPGDNSVDYKKINRQTFLGVTGQPADISTIQTFTNKTLTSPIITVLDDEFTLQDDADPTKQAQFQLSGITAGQTRVITLPDASATMVGTATTQTLTNKTLTSPAITGGSITNSTISVDAISEYTSANGVTVDGLNIKDGKLNTNNSVVTANITDTAVTPAKLQTGTGSSWVWASYVPTLTNLSGGTLSYARYTQIGKTVFVRFKYILGGAGVAGPIRVSLPVSAEATQYPAAGYNSIGTVSFLDSGNANFCGEADLDLTTGSFTINVLNAGGTYLAPTVLSSTVPFTWAINDAIVVNVTYEAA